MAPADAPGAHFLFKANKPARISGARSLPPQITKQLSQVLPGVVDKLTPQGRAMAAKAKTLDLSQIAFLSLEAKARGGLEVCRHRRQLVLTESAQHNRPQPDWVAPENITTVGGGLHSCFNVTLFNKLPFLLRRRSQCCHC